MATLEDLAKAIDEVITHRLDILTESDWFTELIDNKIKEAIKNAHTLSSNSDHSNCVCGSCSSRK